MRTTKLPFASAFKVFQPLANRIHRLSAYDTSTLRTQSILSDPATPLEKWCVQHLEDYYTQSLQIKCPFFRRRAADALDAIDMMVRFLILRHKSLIDAPLGSRTAALSKAEQEAVDTKVRHLTTTELFPIILQDWKIRNDKGYYITGRLNATIYRNDCVFDGPDPDMPVRGLRKYLNAASQLFDYGSSYARLEQLHVTSNSTLQAKWKMEGVLRLPWRPLLPEWTGTTTYYLDDEGLVYRHVETWDMSVMEAFVKTFQPQIGYKIWNDDCLLCEDDDEDGIMVQSSSSSSSSSGLVEQARTSLLTFMRKPRRRRNPSNSRRY